MCSSLAPQAVLVHLPSSETASPHPGPPLPGLPASCMASHQQSEQTAISGVCLRKLITLHFHMIYELLQLGLAHELQSFLASALHGQATWNCLCGFLLCCPSELWREVLPLENTHQSVKSGQFGWGPDPCIWGAFALGCIYIMLSKLGSC